MYKIKFAKARVVGSPAESNMFVLLNKIIVVFANYTQAHPLGKKTLSRGHKGTNTAVIGSYTYSNKHSYLSKGY